MNHEGYRDPTAEYAVARADKYPAKVAEVVRSIKQIAGLAGFEIIGRIQLREKASGREYR